MVVPTHLSPWVTVTGKGDGSGTLRGFSSRFPELLVKKEPQAGSRTPTTEVWAVYTDFLILGSGRGCNFTAERCKHSCSQATKVNMKSDEQRWYSPYTVINTTPHLCHLPPQKPITERPGKSQQGDVCRWHSQSSPGPSGPSGSTEEAL